MPGAASNSGIRDNHRRGLVADFLKAKIRDGSRLSVVSAYFTIYAYEALKDHLDRIEHLDFLFGEPRFIASLDPDKTEKKAFILDGHGLQLANRLQQKRVARECAEWIREKVEIRSVRHAQLLHGKMYHIANAGVEEAILGSSNFTVRGLGLGAGNNNIELNLEVDSTRDRRDLKAWFDELWNEPDLVADVKQEVLLYLDQLYQNHAPEFIYYKTLFHVFENFLADQEKGGLLDQNIKIVDTGIWQALFEFQRDGVKGAINKILKHNGCILADSVGLGKTFEALAVIKYFELKNERALVLCPKKLRENWTVYRHNDALNPFIGDRFRYDVLSHTDLSRDGGKSGDLDLATFNWGNFDLVVIDESHNFRNNTPGRRDEDGNLIRKSRYQRLMDDIIKAGVKTKVLLLSATPVNNDLRDLRNQIYFLTENNDHAFKDSIGIPSLKEALAVAQKTFSLWAKKKSGERQTKDLLEKLSSAFFKLLDELTIARSRKHILRYYKSSIAALGGFPERRKPESIFSDIDLQRRFFSYDRLNDEIGDYKLSLFAPSRYLSKEANRQLLEAAPLGLYAVVPPHPEHQIIAPGVIWCFRQNTTPHSALRTPHSEVNPLQPYYLVYARDDGNVRFTFAQPKQILEIYRLLCAGKTQAHEQLCQLFDAETNNGADMSLYNELLATAVDSIARTFQKRVAAGLHSSRDFVIPEQQPQANETADFELVTWLVIRPPA